MTKEIMGDDELIEAIFISACIITENETEEEKHEKLARRNHAKLMKRLLPDASKASSEDIGKASHPFWSNGSACLHLVVNRGKTKRLTNKPTGRNFYGKGWKK